MSKHTPGPWGLNPGKDRDHDTPLIRVSGADGSSFAFVFENNHTGELNVDDARLIAAAPELLAALREIVDMQESESTEKGRSLLPEYMADVALSAINKATKEEA